MGVSGSKSSERNRTKLDARGILKILAIPALLLLAVIPPSQSSYLDFSAVPTLLFIFLILCSYPMMAGIGVAYSLSALARSHPTLYSISRKSAISCLLGGFPGCALLIASFTFTKFTNIFIDAPFRILMISPIIFSICLYWKGFVLFERVENMKPVTSRTARFTIGSLWAIVTSLAGICCGMISMVLALGCLALLVGPTLAPEGFVWRSTGGKIPAVGYVLGLVGLVVGAAIGFGFYVYFARFVNKITFRTINTKVPSWIGGIVSVTMFTIVAVRILVGLPPNFFS